MTLESEICQAAARCIVEEGMDYAAAKKRAAEALGLGRGVRWPSNEDVEDAVREHIALFCAEEQAADLSALRRLAAQWMKRLHSLRPHLSGAVWRGTATRLNDIQLELYCDDSKQAELWFLNEGIAFDTHSQIRAGHPPLDVLSVNCPCPALKQNVGLHLWIYEHDDLRGALKPDSRGRTWRGDLGALESLLSAGDAAPSIA